MPVIMHDRDFHTIQPLNHLPLHPRPIRAHRPQANRMPNNTERLYTRALRHERRTQPYAAQHDPDRQVRIDGALPATELHAAAEDAAAAGGAVHDVDGLVWAVVGAGDGGHDGGIVAHDDGLAAARLQRRVRDAAEEARGQAGAVYDDVGAGGAAVVQSGGVGDVGGNAAAQDGAVAQALRRQPGQVERGVDADGGEGRAAVYPGRELVLAEDAELRKLRPAFPLEGRRSGTFFTESDSSISGALPPVPCLLLFAVAKKDSILRPYAMIV
ncbi:hypothetical protein LTR50_003970 [Elasticomyces elasticus]|nr:hypothetical protein LTR50_003970 [Elasticomyces elasticus]